MQWISVQDRIPPFDTRVLVLGYKWEENEYCEPSRFKSMKMCMAYNECFDEMLMTEINDLSDERIKIGGIDFEILYWCPIPEEPKELLDMLEEVRAKRQ